MDSNTHSVAWLDRLAALEAQVDQLAAQPPDGLADAALAEGMGRLGRLANRLDGHRLAWLAAVDARGAAGADQGTPAPSTASWLRNRLRLGAGAAHSLVRTARALFRGPLTATGQALVAGEVSLAHAQVLAHRTHDLADHMAVEAEPVLLEAARRLDPARLRQAIAHLRRVADPEGPTPRPSDATSAGGCGWHPPSRAWSPFRGCWIPRPARACWPPWNRWPAPPTRAIPAPVASGGPMPSPSWPAATWRAAGSPRPVGCGPSCWSPWTWTPWWVSIPAWAGR
jgi:Domain of unknown function (DUF222)